MIGFGTYSPSVRRQDISLLGMTVDAGDTVHAAGAHMRMGREIYASQDPPDAGPPQRAATGRMGRSEGKDTRSEVITRAIGRWKEMSLDGKRMSLRVFQFGASMKPAAYASLLQASSYLSDGRIAGRVSMTAPHLSLPLEALGQFLPIVVQKRYFAALPAGCVSAVD
jgi:hypothetical protein